MSISRNRGVYGVAAGLVSRSGWGEQRLPVFIAEYAEDTLWAFLLYLAVGVVCVRAGVWKLALGVLLFAYAIEFSQLYRADWINRVRENPLGALALGKTFVWTDLPCYTAGVAAGVAFDLVWRTISSGRRVLSSAP